MLLPIGQPYTPSRYPAEHTMDLDQHDIPGQLASLGGDPGDYTDQHSPGDDQPLCTGQLPVPGDHHVDSYTEGIELSNACRKFYVTRVQVAEGIKSKMNTNLGSSGSKSLDDSMGTLRREVVS